MLHNAWSCQTPQTQYGIMESQPVTTMEHVYSGRTLLPLKTTKLQVPILSTRSREVTLQRGTLLGKVFAAEAVTTTTSSLNRVSQIRVEDAVSLAHEEVIKKMVDGLRPELTSKQRQKFGTCLRNTELFFLQETTMLGERLWWNTRSTRATTNPYGSCCDDNHFSIKSTSMRKRLACLSMES